jgi:hypothetical protein
MLKRNRRAAPLPVRGSRSGKTDFDDAFYQTIIADIVNHKASVEDAAALE